MEQTFWQKNKVFIIGLMSAIALAITPFAQEGNPGDTVKWTTVGFAAAIAVLSYFGKNWKGQGLTIFGIIGNAAAVAGNLLTQGSHVNVNTFIMQLVIQTFIAIALAASSNPETVPVKPKDP